MNWNWNWVIWTLVALFTVAACIARDRKTGRSLLYVVATIAGQAIVRISMWVGMALPALASTLEWIPRHFWHCWREEHAALHRADGSIYDLATIRELRVR